MIERNGQTSIFHQVVKSGGVLHLSGIIADNRDGVMREQSREVFSKIDSLLNENGSNKSMILSTLIFVTDLSAKSEMNISWNEWISASDLPARATIGVNDLGEGVLIEVVVTAAAA